MRNGPRPIVAANWKMHHGPAAARAYMTRFRQLWPPRTDRRVLLFPPAVSLLAAAEIASDRTDLWLGVQNIHWERQGAFTGEIAAAMAAEAGARVALVGHSERRHLFGETIAMTVRKTRAALDAGLAVLLCVGETEAERDAGRAADVVADQLEPVLAALAPEDWDRFAVAYEPVWAIGTGRTATPTDAAAMHAEVRRCLARQGAPTDLPVLYGGSVKPDNAAELLRAPGVDGLLVGGASLDPDAFATICAAAD